MIGIEARQPGESLAAFRGRQRRTANDAVDALGLKEGDPIYYAGSFKRFNPKRHTRSDRSYGFIRRLTPAETAKLEDEEARKAEERRKQDAWRAEQDAFSALPEVRAARTVQHALEWDMREAIGKLSTDEWIALAAKF